MASKEKNPRFVFTPELNTVFLDLYNTHDGGRFLHLMVNGNAGTNLARMDAWVKFTEAFNKVCVKTKFV